MWQRCMMAQGEGYGGWGEFEGLQLVLRLQLPIFMLLTIAFSSTGLSQTAKFNKNLYHYSWLLFLKIHSGILGVVIIVILYFYIHNYIRGSEAK